MCDCIEPGEEVVKINCHKDWWRIINCGGSFNTPTEGIFTLVEGELLGIAKALHKARYNIMGHSNLPVVTYHKPLVRFLDNEDVKEEENRRLMNLRRKCDNYKFKISYNPGSTNQADVLSQGEEIRRMI